MEGGCLTAGIQPERVRPSTRWAPLGAVALVSGGLTYGADEDGWIGFDTAHFNDYWSAEEIYRFGGDTTYTWSLEGLADLYKTPWTIEKMIAETENLARQAASVLDIPTAGV